MIFIDIGTYHIDFHWRSRVLTVFRHTVDVRDAQFYYRCVLLPRLRRGKYPK